MLLQQRLMLVGMTYCTICPSWLPLYANLGEWTRRLLGSRITTWAPRREGVLLITVPLSKAGIMAGFMLVFIPSVVICHFRRWAGLRTS